MTEETKERVLKIHENLEKVNEGMPIKEYNLDKAQQCGWCCGDGMDHKLVIVPAKDYTGVCIYFYTNDLNTARIGLSTEAVIHLMEGIQKVVIDDKEFLKVLKEKKEKQDESVY